MLLYLNEWEQNLTIPVNKDLENLETLMQLDSWHGYTVQLCGSHADTKLQLRAYNCSVFTLRMKQLFSRLTDIINSGTKASCVKCSQVWFSFCEGGHTSHTQLRKKSDIL